MQESRKKYQEFGVYFLCVLARFCFVSFFLLAHVYSLYDLEKCPLFDIHSNKQNL